MQCAALTKAGHPCRGYGRCMTAGGNPLKGVVCHMHSTFYDDPNTLYDIIERHSNMDQTPTHRGWCIAALKSRPAQETFYGIGMAALAEANIRDKLDSDSPSERGRADYMYETFMKAGIFEPGDLQPMWRRGVLRQLRILQYCAMESRIPPHYQQMIQQLLVPYFKGMSAEYTVSYLLTAMALPPFRGEHVSFDISGIMWLDILECACRTVDMREFLSIDLDGYLETFAKLQRKLQPVSPLMYPPIHENVRELLKEHIQKAKRGMANKLAPLKEELMGVCWSPKRVAAALEAGLMPEDM